ASLNLWCALRPLLSHTRCVLPLYLLSFPTRRSSDLFEKALTEAKAVMADADATQEEVNTAWDNLLNGIWGLGLTQGDKTMLNLRSEEHTSELQSRFDLVCRLLLEKKKQQHTQSKKKS